MSVGQPDLSFVDVNSIAASPKPGSDEFAALCSSLDHRSMGYRVSKRAFDIVFSVAVLAICLIPGLLLSAIIVFETKATPIYSQTRVGRRDKPFRIFKVRSMVADSGNVEKYLDIEQLEQWKRERKVDNDPRVTRVGKNIRKISSAPAIIGAPGDGEPTKSLSHTEDSLLDLQKYECRLGPLLDARHHYTSFQFLSFAAFGGPKGALGLPLCARMQVPFACVGTAA